MLVDLSSNYYFQWGAERPLSQWSCLLVVRRRNLLSSQFHPPTMHHSLAHRLLAVRHPPDISGHPRIFHSHLGLCRGLRCLQRLDLRCRKFSENFCEYTPMKSAFVILIIKWVRSDRTNYISLWFILKVSMVLHFMGPLLCKIYVCN